MKNIKITIHWSFFVLGFLMAIYGKLGIFLCCLATVIFHEMGHSLIGRKLGYKLNIITLMPYGAMLSGNNRINNTNDEIKIAIAGPIVNAIIIIFCSILFNFSPCLNNILCIIINSNIYTLSFNLLPVYPLDGGRILNAILAKKIGKAKSFKFVKIIGYSITILFFILFFISFIFKLNYMIGINAMFLLMGLLEEDTSAYYENLSCFSYGKPHFHYNVIKLDLQTPLYMAYKSVIDKNASKVSVLKNKKVFATISRKKLIDCVLKLPLDTKIETLVE